MKKLSDEVIIAAIQALETIILAVISSMTDR